MASSGSYSNSVGNLTLTMNWQITSQNQSGNYSWVRMDLVLSSPYSVSSSASKSGWTTINNNQVTFNHTIGSQSGSWSKTIATREIRVDHNSDGTKSVPLSAGFNPQITLSGRFISQITVSGTPTLDRINTGGGGGDTTPPRSTFNAISNQTFGSSFLIYPLRESTDVTHTVKMDIGGYTQTQTGVGAVSDPFNVLVGWASGFTNVPHTTGTVTVTSYYQGRNIGSYSRSFRVDFPSSMNPTASNLTPTDAESGKAVPSSWNIWVQNKSKVQFNISASPKYSATISSVVVTRPDGISKRATLTGGKYLADFDSSISGLVTFYITVTDSRGKWTTYESPVTFQAYSPPSITDAQAERATSVSNPNPEGTRVRVFANQNISSLGGKNVATRTLHIKRSSDTSWGTALSSGWNDGSWLLAPLTRSTNYEWDVRFTLADQFETTELILSVPTGYTTMDFLAGGTGIALGKVATQPDTLDIGFSTVRLPTIDNLETKIQSIDSQISTATSRLDAIDTRTNGGWTAFNPGWKTGSSSLAIGNGLLEGWYQHIGYTCTFLINLRRGSTTNVGSGLYTFELPVQARVGNFVTGGGYTSNGELPLAIRGITGTTIGVVGPGGRLSNTYPGNWSTNQTIVIQGIYHTASPGA